MNEQKILIFIPTFNCSKFFEKLLNDLENIDYFKNINYKFELLIMDNNSNLSEVDHMKQTINKSRLNKIINFKDFKDNVGYAGNQKRCFEYLINSDFEYMIMLHGDGQYTADLLKKIIPELNDDLDIIYGYRDKKTYKIDETPYSTFLIITALNFMENFILNLKIKEWHSGFVSYSKKFIQSIRTDKLTDTRHIDGNILFIGSIKRNKIRAVPIYKLYKGFEQFQGFGAIKYVFNVISLMFHFRSKKNIKYWFKD